MATNLNTLEPWYAPILFFSFISRWGVASILAYLGHCHWLRTWLLKQPPTMVQARLLGSGHIWQWAKVNPQTKGHLKWQQLPSVSDINPDQYPRYFFYWFDLVFIYWFFQNELKITVSLKKMNYLLISKIILNIDLERHFCRVLFISGVFGGTCFWLVVFDSGTFFSCIGL